MDRKPKAEFLLGLGEPLEPNSWDISEGVDNEKDLLMASEMAENELNHNHQIGVGLLNHLLSLM